MAEHRSELVIPVLRKPAITLEQLQRYAKASGDWNPIHLDEAAAKARGLDAVIAHGMLSMGFIGQLLTDAAGAGSVHRIRVRFGGMVKVGDELTCCGRVTSLEVVDDGRRIAGVEVWAENQRGERVTYGDAEVFVTGHRYSVHSS